MLTPPTCCRYSRVLGIRMYSYVPSNPRRIDHPENLHLGLTAETDRSSLRKSCSQCYLVNERLDMGPATQRRVCGAPPRTCHVRVLHDGQRPSNLFGILCSESAYAYIV
jgi:hypothetical protein